jgi:hypothetical protein
MPLLQCRCVVAQEAAAVRKDYLLPAAPGGWGVSPHFRTRLHMQMRKEQRFATHSNSTVSERGTEKRSFLEGTFKRVFE